MKKLTVLFLLVTFLSGCATYKFQPGKAPYDTGYVVSRDNYAILEYTVGSDNTVPEKPLAKERFKRRRAMVEYYYKKMGYIEGRVKETFLNPAVSFAKFTTGIFRLPAVAISDYRYEHDPKYKERVRELQTQQDAREDARINKLKEELRAYVLQDTSMEKPVKQEAAARALVPEQPAQAAPSEVKPQPPEDLPKQREVVMALAQVEVQQAQKQKQAPAQTQEKKVFPKKERPVKAKKVAKPKKEPAQRAPREGEIKAVIIARPQKGYSPLKVNFSADNSFSTHGKIIAYQWDFGDGDTSIKKDPSNTYWSTTYGSREFTITLTINDNKGNTATVQQVIEVKSK